LANETSKTSNSSKISKISETSLTSKTYLTSKKSLTVIQVSVVRPGWLVGHVRQVKEGKTGKRS
jgi:hypothetical protein